MPALSRRKSALRVEYRFSYGTIFPLRPTQISHVSHSSLRCPAKLALGRRCFSAVSLERHSEPLGAMPYLQIDTIPNLHSGVTCEVGTSRNGRSCLETAGPMALLHSRWAVERRMSVQTISPIMATADQDGETRSGAGLGEIFPGDRTHAICRRSALNFRPVARVRTARGQWKKPSDANHPRTPPQKRAI